MTSHRLEGSLESSCSIAATSRRVVVLPRTVSVPKALSARAAAGRLTDRRTQRTLFMDAPCGIDYPRAVQRPGRPMSRGFSLPPRIPGVRGGPRLDVVAGIQSLHQGLRTLRPAVGILLQAFQNQSLELHRQRPFEALRGRLRYGLHVALDDLDRPSVEDGGRGQ